jgi:prepilin-type N-terminal cleavage/methylation domain-containing protein
MKPCSFNRVADREAFSLLEMLVAMAVVSLMLAFMFNMVAQAIRTWEIGARRMEGSQAARIGMNFIAQELQYATAGVRTGRGNQSPDIVNIIPFVAITNATTMPGGGSASLQASEGSDQLFFVAPLGAISGTRTAFGEIGYLNVFARSTGAFSMASQRYFLTRHGGFTVGDLKDTTLQDFYLRGIAPNPATNWINTPVANQENRTPIVDNCIQFTLAYASNNGGNVVWTKAWTSRTNLPLGVLVTMRVLDAKSANRLAGLRGNNQVTEEQLAFLTNGQPSSDPVVQILREGTTTLRRFVPLLQSATP